MKEKLQSYLGAFLMLSVFVAGGISLLTDIANAVNINSQVIVGNAAPTASGVSVNNAASIILTPNATTTIRVNFTVTDANGCGDVFFNGNVTTTVFRKGVTSACAANNLNCYITSAVTTNSCPFATSSQTSAAATTSVDIWYFAQASDASSSFASDIWSARVLAADQTGATSSATSSDQELITLTAINVTTSSLNFGTLAANADTGAVNQSATTTNAGNSTTSLQLSANQTLSSGGNTIVTSSQHYSTTTFTFPGTSIALSDTPATVAGFTLTSPTSTANVQKATLWGVSVPNGTATGTYTGINVFSSLFQP